MNVSRSLQILLIGVMLAGALCQAADYSNVAAIFQLGMGARPSGMGGAFLALADDENAVFYNPAGLGRLKRIGVSSLLSRRFASISYGAIGLTFPNFGAAVMQLDSGAIPVDETVIRYISRAGILSIGLSLDPIAVGGRVRVYRVEEPFSGMGWTVDPAILITTDHLNLGMLLENLFSGPIEYEDGHSEAWRTDITLGAALKLPLAPVSWNLVLQGSGLLSRAPQLAGGVEVWAEGVAAQLGYDGSATTSGLSVDFDSFQVDWAYTAHPELPDSYRVSLTFRF